MAHNSRITAFTSSLFERFVDEISRAKRRS
jgi:hypothetical protein